MYVYIFQEATQYANENDMMFLETSAKTGMNINEVFHQLGPAIIFSACILLNNTKLKKED